MQWRINRRELWHNLLETTTIAGVIGHMFRIAAWMTFIAAMLLLGPCEASAQQWPYHFGFKKSKDGSLPSIDGEGFKAVIEKHGAIFLGDTGKRVLYLTFDNGYENGYTSQILDTLKSRQVPAVFFVTGHYVKDQPDLVRRMVAEGHIVGNHSWNHPDLTRLTDEQIRTELNKVRDQVAAISGQKEMRFMRPPRGIFSERTLAVSKALGYTNVFWSVAYKDWDVRAQRGRDYAYRNVMSQLHPGAVILLHTVSRDNAEALADIIDGARKQGYEFRSLDELVPASPAMVPKNIAITRQGQIVANMALSDYLLPVFPLKREEQFERMVDELARKLYKPPQNAYIGPQGEIVDEQIGWRLDRNRFVDQLNLILYSGVAPSSMEAPLVAVYARVDGELLSTLRDKRIGSYTTYYNAGNRKRAHNITLAANSINNVVIFPDEMFSFNRTLGPRTSARGYKPAPVIVQGELSEGVGGGICQVSSTLFNAADRAGLDIVERYSHSRKVPYVLPGRDATVSWGGPDFVFRNPYNQPVLIRAHAANGRVYVSIYSTEALEHAPRQVPDVWNRLPREVRDSSFAGSGQRAGT